MANKLAAAGPGSKFRVEGAEPAGFWAGFWHGAIMPITFFISLFNPDVRIYETHNTGKGYDFGFVLGASAAFGGGKKGVRVEVDGNDKDDEAGEEAKDDA
jgi:hypothetical protein